MAHSTRLPAYPLVTSDPYLSIWSRTEHPASDDTRHWTGARKRMTLAVEIDGTSYALLGRPEDVREHATLTGRFATPTETRYTYEAAGLDITLSFRAPLLLDDLDLASMPVTFISLVMAAKDGKTHQAEALFLLHDDICHNGQGAVPMIGDAYMDMGLSVGYMGRMRQDMLCHTGDHITIDWGYAYLAAASGVSFVRVDGHWALEGRFQTEVGSAKAGHTLLLGYDDVASIQYFGHVAKAWYARGGMTIQDALHHCYDNRGEIQARCEALDSQLIRDARQAGGESYVKVITAGYRQSIAAHKLIADAKGNPIFLSKEDDSNGCIGTVDVSYPSIPLYLLYAPELVRGMCRPVLHFASLPVWQADFAPHDVGRYPHATGQVYGLKGYNIGKGITDSFGNGDVYPPLYLYPKDNDLYELRYQMPVEECGNMILMLAAALKADGDDSLIKEYLPLLGKWVKYLVEYGEDPGEQLCTDDFAGHLAHNVNLAFKAVFGVAAYAYIMDHLGRKEEGARYREMAGKMAASVHEKSKRGDHTSLTLDGEGWSLKYNAVWDTLFDFGLLPEDFFTKEVAYYKKMQNTYGAPLDSRADYTKSDWILWAATLTGDAETVEVLSAPMAKYLEESATRVPFSDWYDTKTGRFVSFINRTVQGGLFMPLLKKKWKGL